MTELEMDPRTEALIEAAAELMLLSRGFRANSGRDEWRSFAATVLPLLFEEDLSADDIVGAIETAARQEGLN